MSRAAVAVSGDQEWPVARISGEIDLTNVDDLAATLRNAVGNRSHGLVLDLSDVEYLDSTGLRLLFRLLRELNDRQQQLRVVVPESAVIYGVLILGGVGSAVPMFPTIQNATAPGTGNHP